MANGRRRNQVTRTNDNAALRDYNFDYEVQVANLVNQERTRAGLSRLTLSDDISYVARTKSQDMRDNRYFAHESPIFGSPFDMLAQFGITYRLAAENIARGQRTPQAVMDAWMNSEGHRRNILNPSFTEIGVGFMRNSRGDTYWTQMFLTR